MAVVGATWNNNWRRDLVSFSPTASAVSRSARRRRCWPISRFVAWFCHPRLIRGLSFGGAWRTGTTCARPFAWPCGQLTFQRSFRAFSLPNDLPESSRTRLLESSTFGSFSRKSARHSTNNRANWTRDTAHRRSGDGTSSLFGNRWNFDVLGGLRSLFVLLIWIGSTHRSKVLIGLQMYSHESRQRAVRKGWKNSRRYRAHTRSMLSRVIRTRAADGFVHVDDVWL